MTRYVGFDIESTGIDPRTDRIVTFSVIAQDSSREQTLYEWTINPGVEIPEGAAAVHGVTTEIAVRDGRHPKEVLPEIMSVLNYELSFEDAILTAYNCPFDLTMLREEYKRHGIIPKDSTYVEDLVAHVGIIDPLVMDKEIYKFRRGSRKLTDVAEFHGFNLVNAHNSTADVEATIYLAERFMSLIPEEASVQEILELQATAKKRQAESLSEYFKKQDREDWRVDGSWPIQTS